MNNETLMFWGVLLDQIVNVVWKKERAKVNYSKGMEEVKEKTGKIKKLI